MTKFCLTAFLCLVYYGSFAQSGNIILSDPDDPEKCVDLSYYRCETTGFNIYPVFNGPSLFLHRLRVTLYPETPAKRVYEQPRECCNYNDSRCCNYDYTCCNYKYGRHTIAGYGYFGAPAYTYMRSEFIDVALERCRSYSPTHFSNEMTVIYSVSGETGSMGLVFNFSDSGTAHNISPRMRYDGSYRKCYTL